MLLGVFLGLLLVVVTMGDGPGQVFRITSGFVTRVLPEWFLRVVTGGVLGADMRRWARSFGMMGLFYFLPVTAGYRRFYFASYSRL